MTGPGAPTPTPSGPRRLDRVAVGAALRRLRRDPEPPWLHREIGRRLVDRLDGIRLAPSRIVDWWSGPAGVEAALRERWPKARLVAVEPDVAWLERRERSKPPLWRRWVGAGAGIEAVVDTMSATDGIEPSSADLVVANLCLHAAADPPALFARWHAALRPGGVLAFSAFGPATLAALRDAFAVRAWSSPGAPFVDMHDFGDMLGAAGFAEPVVDQETITLTWATAEAALAELHGLGGNVDATRFAGLRTPRWRAALLDVLRERTTADGRIALDFEVAYGHGFRAEPRPGPGEAVPVSLDRLHATLGKRPPAG